MATCSKCIHFADCLIDKRTRYYGKDIACANVEELCKFFKDKSNFVEVVRCRDCKHWDCYGGEDAHKGDCNELVGLDSCMYEDDFCSCGERRADNER